MVNTENISEGSKPESKGRILVVEDERQIARFIELELTHEGYTVVMAPDGIEALVQARLNRPDLVVLDLMIPRIDGLEVCRRLRSGNTGSSQDGPHPCQQTNSKASFSRWR